MRGGGQQTIREVGDPGTLQRLGGRADGVRMTRGWSPRGRTSGVFHTGSRARRVRTGSVGSGDRVRKREGANRRIALKYVSLGNDAIARSDLSVGYDVTPAKWATRVNHNRIPQAVPNESLAGIGFGRVCHVGRRLREHHHSKAVVGRRKRTRELRIPRDRTAADGLRKRKVDALIGRAVVCEPLVASAITCSSRITATGLWPLPRRTSQRTGRSLQGAPCATAYWLHPTPIGVELAGRIGRLISRFETAECSSSTSHFTATLASTTNRILRIDGRRLDLP